MKKKFNLENLECAHCAAKMEEAIKNIEGVQDATINFMTSKLMVEADDARFNEIMKQAKAACKKIEPDCEILGV